MSENKRRLILTPLATITTSAQHFLDADEYLPLGTLTIFTGQGAAGKSTLALDYVAKITNGTLPGRYNGNPRNVLIVQHEDDPGMVLVPRLMAAGANLDLITLLSVGSEDGFTTSPSLVHDIELIRAGLDELDPALMVLDPLSSSIGGDLNAVADVRRALNPLTQIAQEYNLTVIGIAHARKGTQGSLSDRTSGSHAFRDVARSVLQFAVDKDTGERIVTVDKASYSKNGGRSFKFVLVDSPVLLDSGETHAYARVELLGESDLSVEDLMARENNRGEREDEHEATTWLRAYLKHCGGSALSSEIKRAANKERIGERQLRTARERLCDTKRDEFGGKTTWRLRDSHDIRDIYDSDDKPREGVIYGTDPSYMGETDPSVGVTND